MNTLGKRNFYLMLSIPQGQGIANVAGFAPTSEEVAQKETESITKYWIILGQHGVLDSCIESAEWFYDVFSKHLVSLDLVSEEDIEESKDKTIASLASFVIASTYKMMTEDVIHLGGHL